MLNWIAFFAVALTAYTQGHYGFIASAFLGLCGVVGWWIIVAVCTTLLFFGVACIGHYRMQRRKAV